MHKEINEPYSLSFRYQSGIYRVNVGDLFYVGSTGCFEKRHDQHKSDLARGIHHCTRLQEEFNKTGRFEMILLKMIPRKRDDSKADHDTRLRLNEQWMLDDNKGNPHLANSSESAFHNSNIGENLKARWQNPQFREAQIKRMKARRGDAVTPESRERMAQAKRGVKNPKSHACEITMDGKSRKFESVREAALAYGVNQQAMDLWMRGVVPWPGTGKRRPRAGTAHLTGMTGRLI